MRSNVAESNLNPNTPAHGSFSGGAPTLSQVWHLPLLLLGLILFGAGLYLVLPEHHQEDHLTPVLIEAKDLIGQSKYAQALAALNHAIPLLDRAPATHRAEFHALTGDAISLGQRSAGWSLPLNHRNVVEAYEKAEKIGQGLSDQTPLVPASGHGKTAGQGDPAAAADHAKPDELAKAAEQSKPAAQAAAESAAHSSDHYLSAPRRTRMAMSMAELGKVEQALKLLDEAGETGSAARQNLLRQLALSSMERRDDKQAGERLELLLKQLDVTRANEIWAIARQAELLSAAGNQSQAIDLLLRRLARLQGEKETPLAEMMVQLARCYLADSKPVQAERWLSDARKQLDPSDALNAEVLTRLGEIRFAEEKVSEALELYTQVVAQFTGSASHLAALIGKAECEARQGSLDGALADFETAAESLRKNKPPQESAALAARLAGALETQHDLLATQGDLEQALRFLKMLQGLLGDKPTAQFLSKMATLHEQIARQKLDLTEGQIETPRIWAKLKKAERTEVAEHYASAAEFYHRYSQAMKKSDPAIYSTSLWRAADLFDRSGLHEQAVKLFGEYVLEREGDPKRISAMARVAQAYQAQGDLGQAVRFYQRLADDFGTTPEGYASLVPLAQAMLAQDLKNSDQAERVLLSVVTDHPAIRPESIEYRQALIELGQLYYRRGGEGDYEKAIARLDEVVGRYSDRESIPELQFNLGDSYRKSVEQIDSKLAGSLPPSTRTSLANERSQRLDQARRHFDGVISAYEKRDPASLSPMQRLYLRNSYFYRADCAYELGEYEGPQGSIALYEAAVQRYENEPAALVGLVQIVNSFGEMKRWEQARKANERAKVYLRRIPEEAFKDPNLPMSREHWQKWLEWTSQLASTEASVPTAPPAP